MEKGHRKQVLVYWTILIMTVFLFCMTTMQKNNMKTWAMFRVTF